jgi:elongation factor G
MAFKVAASICFQDAAKHASPVILEPIMSVEVVVPEDFMGSVVGDISGRRGRIQGMEARGGAQVIAAQVPLKEMFGYATELRSMTQGRATYTMQPSHYEPVPQAVSDEITARASGTEDRPRA